MGRVIARGVLTSMVVVVLQCDDALVSVSTRLHGRSCCWACPGTAPIDPRLTRTAPSNGTSAGNRHRPPSCVAESSWNHTLSPSVAMRCPSRVSARTHGRTKLIQEGTKRNRAYPRYRYAARNSTISSPLTSMRWRASAARAYMASASARPVNMRSASTTA